MFMLEWREFPSAPCLAGKDTWWQLASRFCWNRERPWHASEPVSVLIGLRTYQHSGICNEPIAGKHTHTDALSHGHNVTLNLTFLLNLCSNHLTISNNNNKPCVRELAG